MHAIEKNEILKNIKLSVLSIESIKKADFIFLKLTKKSDYVLENEISIYGSWGGDYDCIVIIRDNKSNKKEYDYLYKIYKKYNVEESKRILKNYLKNNDQRIQKINKKISVNKNTGSIKTTCNLYCISNYCLWNINFILADLNLVKLNKNNEIVLNNNDSNYLQSNLKKLLELDYISIIDN